MKNFSGDILFLDRSDINTDEIIPARYLTEITREALGPHLLEDLSLDGFSASNDLEGKEVVISRHNFGCGSSREHAPWALEARGINIVVAPSFARIFRQNMFNCGMLAAEVAETDIEKIFSTFAAGKSTLLTDMDRQTFTISSAEATLEVAFRVSPFEKSLLAAGGWVEYADAAY